MLPNNLKKILVTGGGGYVGAVLVPKLLNAGYEVSVLDLFFYSAQVLDSVRNHPGLKLIRGDICERWVLEKAVQDCDAVIHLACISNDPSFELDPELGRAVNYDAFVDLVEVARDAGVRRFVYASSSSVYGVKSEPNVTENLPLEPLTDYSKYKAMCEDVLQRKTDRDFVTLILRPATVCGYSPRLRLDLTVNILTNHAVNNRMIKVFGGEQMRPNIHIEDMTDLYVQTLRWRDTQINGKIFNAGYDNYRVIEIARMVRDIVGEDVQIVRTPTDDNRSYHISSERIARELNFRPEHSVEEAVSDLIAAFEAGRIPQSMSDSRYFNIKRMQELRFSSAA